GKGGGAGRDGGRDPPLDPKWEQPSAELVREIEEAGGVVAERFALCQALPLQRVQAVTEGLRAAGYRPVRVRPWAASPRWPAGRGGGGGGEAGGGAAVVSLVLAPDAHGSAPKPPP